MPGRAEGVLLGGSLGPLRAMLGAGLPAGTLRHVRGVAVGRFAGFDGLVDREWRLEDVLADHLDVLGVPVLSGLPIGPGERPVPLGVPAVLDATEGVLTFGLI